MKRNMCPFLVFALLSTAIFAGENHLVDQNKAVGFYGGPAVKVSGVDNQTAVLLGGRGAVIFGNTFIIGGGGYHLSNPIEKNRTGEPYDIDFGYGGLEFGITLGADKLLHFTSNLLLGIGHVDYMSPPGNESLLYVIEPLGCLEINVVEWMRICIGGGYRFVFGIEGVGDLSNSDLWSPSAELFFKFGSF